MGPSKDEETGALKQKLMLDGSHILWLQHILIRLQLLTSTSEQITNTLRNSKSHWSLWQTL